MTEQELRSELSRVQNIKRWLWVGIVACLTGLYLIYSVAAHAQGPGFTSFEIGAMQAGTMVVPLKGEIQLSDSIATFTISGQTATYKVTNKANQNIYLTDGTMLHTMWISPWPGKTKGYKHTLMINFIQDKRLSDVPIIYYCNKRD